MNLLSANVSVFGLTDVGRARQTNEDHFIIVSLGRAIKLRQTSLTDVEPFDRIRGPEALVLVVADGVGGQSGGALASATAVTTLIEYVGEAAGCFGGFDIEREQEFLESLERGVQRAHERIVAEFAEGDVRPATTLTMATLVWPRAYLVHVGDSRAFYMRKGRLRQLTRDQTMGEYMVEAGAWTEEQARKAPSASVLASAVGAPDMMPSVGLIDLEEGDTLLLCTDGLTRHVNDDRIASILEEVDSAERGCRELVDAALAEGARDNVTVIVARCEPERRRTGG